MNAQKPWCQGTGSTYWVAWSGLPEIALGPELVLAAARNLSSLSGAVLGSAISEGKEEGVNSKERAREMLDGGGLSHGVGGVSGFWIPGIREPNGINHFMH